MKMALSILVATAMISISCGGRSNNRINAMEDKYIVAGPGEKTFTQKYGLKFNLPMPEADFLSILKRLNLRYELYGDRDTHREIPPLRRSTMINTSEMQKCYQIYGSTDRTRLAEEAYRAYVDKSHRVVYIENAFFYPPP